MKSNEITIGISDIALYLPRPLIDTDTLVRERVSRAPELEEALWRAVRTTGQRSIRFPEAWEDTVTMAAQAAHSLLDGGRGNDASRLRYLTVGTETPVDQSKPVASYVEGLLQRAGVSVPENISTFQVQHACAGGTLSLMALSGLLAAAPAGEAGMVICSDVARYPAASTAEITQGAGAVSLLVERNPRLIELDLATAGFSSRDVDDFFHPLDSDTARVKGGYSIRCYRQALDSAFLDHCRRRGEEPAEVLRETDLFALHTPFRYLPLRSLIGLLNNHLGMDRERAEEFLAERGLPAALEPSSRVGNLYTGSLFLGLAALLEERLRVLGEGLAGRRLLLASYGAGNTMIVLSGRVAAGAAEVIRRWRLEESWGAGASSSPESYLEYAGRRSGVGPIARSESVPPGSFFLASIREDGYREYGYRHPVASRAAAALLS
jgi:hydroxymethylglutaryl-CoA synthase